MQRGEPQPEEVVPSFVTTMRTLGLHLIAFVVPLYTLAFVATGPHRWYAALPWLLVIPVMWWADKRSGPAHHPALVGAAGWPFDLLLVLLSAIQITNVVLTVSVAHRGQGGIDALVTILLVGVSSGYSAIVVAHELVHRKSRGLFLLGRLLLVTVLYDHFTTEHVRGHHARVGTPEDPATARFGEPYEAFFRRTVPAQFRSAWRIECARLGDEDMRWYDLRLLRSAVVHGVVVEIALAVLTVYAFGPSALLVLVGQAYIAIRLLEAVNYFEHYGLRRVGKKVRPIDSWDSDSWFTLFALVGLSRHADHHAYASRPFHSLRPWDESPKLPNGYIVTALMAIFANRKLRRLLATELERKKLGPFAAPPPSQNMVPSST